MEQENEGVERGEGGRWNWGKQSVSGTAEGGNGEVGWREAEKGMIRAPRVVSTLRYNPHTHTHVNTNTHTYTNRVHYGLYFRTAK